MSTKDINKLVDDKYAGLNENVLGVIHRYWKEDMVWEGLAGIGTMHGIDELEHVYLIPKAVPNLEIAP
jgi:hypothetical protein